MDGILKPTSLGETSCATKDQRKQNEERLNRDDFEFINVDDVPQTPSHFGTLLYIFEDNEAEIKMVIEGSSPTMRHVSRTHRVALD